MKRIYSLLFMALLFGMAAAGCSLTPTENSNTPAGAKTKELVLATTTSTYDSGLLDYLIPYFEAEENYIVQVISLGTGQALELGKNGDADVVLVHARETELQMVAEGHFVDRYDVMYNDFVIVGPEADPAAVRDAADISEALHRVALLQLPFISRGDDSGTHKKEISLWSAANLSPEGNWYLSAGAGMGDTLRMADEMQGYTLTDRASYLSLRDTLDSLILFEGDQQLYNQYGVMAVNPDNYPEINYQGASAFIQFIVSATGQELIAAFQPFGETLFFPNAR